MATEHVGGNLLARCVVGSVLYGLAGPESDVDRVLVTRRPLAALSAAERAAAEQSPAAGAGLPRLVWTLWYFRASVARGQTIFYDVLWQRPAAFSFLAEEFRELLERREELSDRWAFRREAEGFAERLLCALAGGPCRCRIPLLGHERKPPLKCALQLARLAIAAERFVAGGPFPAHFAEEFPAAAATMVRLRDAGDVAGLVALAQEHLGWRTAPMR